MSNKVTMEMVNDSRHQGGRVYGIFKGYCDLHDCCEICNNRIKFWCKIKCRIEDHQQKIIKQICREK